MNNSITTSCSTGTITCSCTCSSCNNQDCNPCDYSINTSIIIKTSSSRRSRSRSRNCNCNCSSSSKYKYNNSNTKVTGSTTKLLVLLLVVCFYFCNVTIMVVQSESVLFKLLSTSRGRTLRNTNTNTNTNLIMQQQQQPSPTLSKPTTTTTTTTTTIMRSTKSRSTATATSTVSLPSKSTAVLSSCSICNASQYIKYHSKFISTVQVQNSNDSTTGSRSNSIKLTNNTTYNVNSTCIQLEQRGQLSLLTSTECTIVHTLSTIPILCGCTSLLSNISTSTSPRTNTSTSSKNATNYTSTSSENVSNSIDDFFNINNSNATSNSSTAWTNTPNSTVTSGNNITNATTTTTTTTTTLFNTNNTYSCTFHQNQSMILSTKFLHLSGSVLNTTVSTGSTEKSLVPILESILLRFIQYDINWTSILVSNITNTTTKTNTTSTDAIAQIITNNYTIRNISLNEVFVNFLEETIEQDKSTLLLNNNFTYNNNNNNNNNNNTPIGKVTNNTSRTTGSISIGNSSVSNNSTNNTLYYPIQILFNITMSFNYTTLAPITNNDTQHDYCQSTIQPSLQPILPLLFEQELIHQQQQFQKKQQSSVCNVTVDNNDSNTNTSIVLVATDNNYTRTSTNIYNNTNYSNNSFQCFHPNYRYIDPFKLLHRVKTQSTTVPYLSSVTTIEIHKYTNVSNNNSNSNIHDLHGTNNDDSVNTNYKNNKAKDSVQLVGLALIVLCALVLLIIIWIFCLRKSQFLSKHCSCCARYCIHTHDARKSQTTDVVDGNKENVANNNQHHHQQQQKQQQILRSSRVGAGVGSSTSNNYSMKSTKGISNMNSNSKYSDSLTSRTSLMHNSTTNKGESLSSIDVYDDNDNHKCNVIARNSSSDDIDDDDTFLNEPQTHQLSNVAATTAIKRNRSYSSLDDEDCYDNIIKNTTTSTTFLTEDDNVIDSINNVFDSVWDGQRKSADSVGHSTVVTTSSAKVGKRPITASDSFNGDKNDDFDFVVRDRTVPPPLPPTISVPCNNTEHDTAIESDIHDDEYGLNDDNMSFQASPLPRHPRYDNFGNPVRMAAQAASYYRSIANNSDVNNNTFDPDNSDSTTGNLIHTPKSTSKQTRSLKYVDTNNNDDNDKPWLSQKRRSSPRDGTTSTSSSQIQKGDILQSPVESHIANIVGTSIEPPFVVASHSVQQHQSLSSSKAGKKQSSTSVQERGSTITRQNKHTEYNKIVVATASKYTDKDNADARSKRQPDEMSNLVHHYSGGITNEKNIKNSPTTKILISSTSSSSSSSSSWQGDENRNHVTDRSVGSLSAPFRKALNIPASSTPSNGYNVVESTRHPISDDDSYSSLEVSRVSVVRQNRQSQVSTNNKEQSQSNYIKKVVTAPAGKLNIFVDTTSNGPMIHKVNPGSPLQGYVYPGDIIVAIDNIETQTMSSNAIMQLMISTAHKSRQFTLLSERTKRTY